MGCLILIHRDDTHLPTLNTLSGVEVSDRCPPDRAAVLVLALQAHAHLFGVASGPEFVDGREDAVCEATGRRGVDVFEDGYQSGSGALNLHQKRGVVEPVPREPRDVVNDHVRRLEPFDVSQHPLEFGTLVCGSPRHAVLHVLANYLCPEQPGFVNRRLSLTWDRVSLGIVRAADLSIARHAKVDQRRRDYLLKYIH
ncbi:hypothetical protein LRS13_13875 [Svornostia abyssi]|uniref:Uncharacterized protein n=1 Tax=Svornostia abyssi TaxID=2898438 RepID=A0ABY5PAV3_9ACTN|nr:hypothetical protein LRS13_13875 [Parviterribacteraceae bacterium J379]